MFGRGPPENHVWLEQQGSDRRYSGDDNEKKGGGKLDYFAKGLLRGFSTLLIGWTWNTIQLSRNIG